MCPVKLFLAHGLRTNQVVQKTWDGMELAAKNHPEGRVVWSRPDEPVFYGTRRTGQASTFRNPQDSPLCFIPCLRS
ncbi:hypothetical protein IMZ48_13120 [Candidatus Bathyarchaeota archaeon]|nr:hypothetical protein [Candidatus Bathyarchaeota archaeon]